jgi:hypothetical protein
MGRIALLGIAVVVIALVGAALTLVRGRRPALLG